MEKKDEGQKTKNRTFRPPHKQEARKLAFTGINFTTVLGTPNYRSSLKTIVPLLAMMSAPQKGSEHLIWYGQGNKNGDRN